METGQLNDTSRILEELAQLRGQLADQSSSLNELLLAHIANQAERDATHREEMRSRDEEHKKELQLAEERGAAQIAELKLHRITLHAEIHGRTDSADTNTTHTEAETGNRDAINTAGWKKVAEGLVEFRSSNYKSNEFHVKRIFAENATFLAPILAICPNVKILLANVLTNAVSRKKNKFKVSPGSEANRLKNLTEAEGKRKKWKRSKRRTKLTQRLWLAQSSSCSFGQILPEAPSGQQGVCSSSGRVAPCQHNFATPFRSLPCIRLNHGGNRKAASRVVQHGARETGCIGRSSLNHGYDQRRVGDNKLLC